MAPDNREKARRSSVELGLTWLKRFAAVLIVALLPAQALGQVGVEGKLGEDASVFEGYRYAVFTVAASVAETKVYLGSEDFDAYLLAVGPDEQVLQNDDGALESVPLPSRSSALTLGEEGRWVVVATTYSPGTGGAYVLGASASSPIEEIAAGNVDTELVERAFKVRDIMSEEERLRIARVENAREILELAEQLFLSSYRRLLTEELESARDDAAASERQASNEVEQYSSTVAELEAARQEVQKLEESRELVDTMIEERLRIARSSLQSAEQSQIGAASRAAGFGALITELREFEVVAEELEALENELLRASEPDRIREIQERLVELRGRGTVLGRALAEQLLDTEIVRRIRFSGFAAFRRFAAESELLGSVREHSISGGPNAILSRIQFGVRGGLIIGDPFAGFKSQRYDTRGARRPESAIDSRRGNDANLLPDLLPFPPPVASYPAALDRAVFGDDPPQSLGQVVDQLSALFRDAGYGRGRHKFLGVPNGFAIMTNIEQHDASGVPLEGEARWSVNVLPVKRLSVWSIAASLFRAPSGHYRVIVVIVTDRSIYNPDPRPAAFALVQDWSTRGDPSFPMALRDEPFTPSHRVYFLVYEFEKTVQSEIAEYILYPSLPLENHLSHTNFAAYVN